MKGGDYSVITPQLIRKGYHFEMIVFPKLIYENL